MISAAAVWIQRGWGRKDSSRAADPAVSDLSLCFPFLKAFEHGIIVFLTLES